MYFINRFFKLIFKPSAWSKLPTYLGLAYLVFERNRLFKKNLYSSYQEMPKGEASENTTTQRSADGTGNDLGCPMMGAKGTRFGRNFPIDKLVPLDKRKLLEPNPRLISEKLLARKKFIAAKSLNLFAAAWIQFMTHDWFVAHETDPKKLVKVPLDPHDTFPENPMSIDTTLADETQEREGFVAYKSLSSHWWDATQIYGQDMATLTLLRSFKDGKLKVADNGHMNINDQTGLPATGIPDNWWLGLHLLHTLFVKEHNAICDYLKTKHADFDDETLFQKARLVNSAVLAKIHTVEWTTGILANPILKKGMNINWSGLVGEKLKRRLRFNHHLLTGIPGSKVNHNKVPFSITEEFIAVYRLHSLLPDDVTVFSSEDGKEREQLPFMETVGVKSGKLLGRFPLEDLVYSFGINHPGALCLHNYPNYLRELHRQKDNKLIDLATIDIFRDRERQIPRYNEFRRLFSLKAAKSFEDLTGHAETAKELEEIYKDIEDVDLLVGCLSERYPKQFGFGETAFQLFTLMATRRLTSDRFFCDDFREEIYTKEGMDWIFDTTMSTVILRHFPTLSKHLNGVENAFAPWNVG